MKAACVILPLVLSSLPSIAQDSIRSYPSDTLRFSGQASSWLNYNQSDLPGWVGARYIPQLNYSVSMAKNRLIDFEGSAYLDGTMAFSPDSTYSVAALRAYRLWARYSTRQFEIRAGLQKINFGSASMLRPLMWFERVDPRDPLRITAGVWGLLGRYYFLNNANIWLWCLYGNEQPRPWEVGKTSQKFPELGGRIQTPVGKGEAGLSFHRRHVRIDEATSVQEIDVPENRIGLDGKWDHVVGLWFEGAWIGKKPSSFQLANQEIVNVGADYTFGIGNGLNVIFEQLIIAYDQHAFEFAAPVYFSAASISYPLTASDTFNAIIYCDWTNGAFYNFVSWKKQFNRFYLYAMGYANPQQYLLPQQSSGSSMFAGRGIQLMFVYNH